MLSPRIWIFPSSCGSATTSPPTTSCPLSRNSFPGVATSSCSATSCSAARAPSTSTGPRRRVREAGYLGLRVVLAESFARIYSRNLVNFGILPLRALDPSQLDELGEGDVLQLHGLASTLRAGDRAIHVVSRPTGIVIAATHDLTDKQVELVLAGGVLTAMRGRFGSRRSSAVADAVV
jgi:hypothetical protein